MGSYLRWEDSADSSSSREDCLPDRNRTNGNRHCSYHSRQSDHQLCHPKNGKKLNKKNWGRRETYRAADIASIVFTGCHGRVQVQRGQELLVQLLKWVRYDYIKWKIIESGVKYDVWKQKVAGNRQVWKFPKHGDIRIHVGAMSLEFRRSLEFFWLFLLVDILRSEERNNPES